MFKKTLIYICLLCLMFMGLHNRAVDATEVNAHVVVDGEEREVETHSTSLELRDNFDVYDQIDSSNISQNGFVKAQLKQIHQSFTEAHGITSDVVGWLSMGEFVYEPFVDTPEDMMKYFRMTLYGDFDWAGVPFMSATSLSTLDGNSLIYGHNMNNGTAFGSLRPLKNQMVFEDAPPLFVYDYRESKFYVYKLFSAIEIVDGEEFIALKNFEDETQRAHYNESILNRSIAQLKEGVEIDFNAPALFLQHCNEIKKGLNRVVFAFVRIDEIPESEIIE